MKFDQQQIDLKVSSKLLANGFWDIDNLPDKIAIQLERSSGGTSGSTVSGQKEGNNVSWNSHFFEKLGGSPAMPTATGPSSTCVNALIPNNEECGIRDVWNHNLQAEFRIIRTVVQKYPYVAMDTEFPGVVARPIGEFRSTADYQYQLLRTNVDLLRIIQLGLTFLDEDGKTPQGYTTWQFNFKFNLSEDMYAQDSIDLLQNSGIQFKKHEEDGIEPFDFAALLMSSGIVLMDNIRWLSFHSGYDFGYLLKLLTDRNLPQDESEFFELLRIYFPVVYDVKYLMKSCKNLKGGLQEVADQLELQRVGPQHQAGSDSLLTGMAFFKMREMFFEDNIDDTKYCGHLYGLGTSFVLNGNTFHDNGDNSSSS
uniref:poly(A)-specific ribonuclease n=1 Tax=Clastoptera arizonana TaxID=38151 RepID=A0A1B6BXZ8_9HEMI